MKLNERIKKLREAKGLSQQEVADKIGISQRVYSYYEEGRFPRDETRLKDIATALGTTVASLVGEDELKQESKFVALARSAESLSPDDRDRLLQIFETAIDAFSKKK